uniref:Radical S-adenosyl methionine domain-containing protein 1, mitochondrial n=1 Tax=Amphora coffeiformis TaxID=265554 RepID=A0A7S3P389_9STRA|mmetsp:Transcript_12866/g.26108  ORF Transcript_12866/g.26108 Transcript_12866/m.26108 type:complete len:498 (-) Transcript_12866:151-1644(-)
MATIFLGSRSRESLLVRALLLVAWWTLFSTNHVNSFSLLESRTTKPGSHLLASSTDEDSSSPASSIGLYVHIPFCRRRCRYCDFAIVPIGNPQQNNHQDRSQLQQQRLFGSYTHAVVKEILSFSLPNEKVTLDTIYFGGGTPSLAPLSMIQTIVGAIRQTFALASNLEFTMEMDPGTFDRTQLQGLRALGVNRISLGVQSFDDSVLEYLGRFHRRKDIDSSIQLLHEIYGPTCNYSIDLIASLPGVSLADWCTTLATAVQLKPSHISVYDLTIEAGTVFGKWYDTYDENDNLQKSPKVSPSVTNPRPLPSPEESAFQYQYTSGYLRAAGYEHYEISSYALPTRRSRHNSLYWGYDTGWYAAGLGATSYAPNGGGLLARPRALADYIDWVAKGDPKSIELEDQQDEDAMESRLQDLVLKRLRTVEGLDLDFVQQQYGQVYADAILQGACLDDLSELVVYEPPVLRLLDSKGFMFSNSIISSIFVALEAARKKLQKSAA